MCGRIRSDIWSLAELGTIIDCAAYTLPCHVCVRSVQYITVRNERGKEMLDSVRPRLVTTPTSSSGNRRPFVMATVESDDE